MATRHIFTCLYFYLCRPSPPKIICVLEQKYYLCGENEVVVRTLLQSPRTKLIASKVRCAPKWIKSDTPEEFEYCCESNVRVYQGLVRFVAAVIACAACTLADITRTGILTALTISSHCSSLELLPFLQPPTASSCPLTPATSTGSLSGTAPSWFESYLADGQLFIYTNNCASHSRRPPRFDARSTSVHHIFAPPRPPFSLLCRWHPALHPHQFHFHSNRLPYQC